MTDAPEPAAHLTPLVSLSADRWLVVNDTVMGGQSTGAVHTSEGRLVFSGTLNTNGGGFASVRSLELDVALRDSAGIVVRVLGDGRQYTCDLREAPRVSGSGVSWKAAFRTQKGATMDVRLPFSSFVPTWRGRVLSPKELGRHGPIQETAGSIGFTIADKTDGEFRLDVLAIASI